MFSHNVEVMATKWEHFQQSEKIGKIWKKAITIFYMSQLIDNNDYNYKYKYLYFASIFKTKKTTWQLLINNYIQYLQKQKLFTNK